MKALVFIHNEEYWKRPKYNRSLEEWLDLRDEDLLEGAINSVKRLGGTVEVINKNNRWALFTYDNQGKDWKNWSFYSHLKSGLPRQLKAYCKPE